MNPFDKLRQTIDKVSINYIVDEGYHSQDQHINIPEQMPMENKTKQKLIENTDIFHQKQRQMIKQINDLALKNERLHKHNKYLEVEKNQLIQENCQLEKNVEILQAKLRQLTNNIKHYQQKQLKYKEQIHRVNFTVEQLSKQLSQQRQVKRDYNIEYSAYKDKMELDLDLKTKQIKELKSKNESLKDQITERVNMLEYNIKKSAENKRQYELNLHNQQKNMELIIDNLRNQCKHLSDKMHSANKQAAVLQQKLSHLSQKFQKVNEQFNYYRQKSEVIQKQNQDSIHTNNQLTNLNRELESQIDNLKQVLDQERKNIKTKIIQIRDQTLELELQMYKRQCRELLQQKVIRGGAYTQRLIEAEYHVDRQYPHLSNQ